MTEEPFDIQQVVRRGLCVGCGACSIRSGGAIPVKITTRGMFEANVRATTGQDLAHASRVCPFSDHAKNEDALAAERYPNLPVDPRLGKYGQVMAGRLTSETELLESSSGGLTNVLLEGLLELQIVDAVVHVGRGSGSELFEYQVSSNVDELRASRKSYYYATTLADVVGSLRGSERRVAIVGVPCFIKAMRLVVDEMPDYRDTFVYFVGIVCGHLKTRYFAESLGWQAGVEPSELRWVDFRVKNPHRRSNRYSYAVGALHSEEVVVRSITSAIDGGWGYAAFQPEACNFCDDVFAETADVVFGDAWLPRYEGDWRGTNVVVTRDERAAEILEAAKSSGRIELEDLSLADAVRTQAGNFRHRRDGLSTRLADDVASGLSVPRKRVSPGYGAVTLPRLALLRQRRLLSRLSLSAFEEAKEQGDITLYLRPMRKAISRYQRLDALSRGPVGIVKYLVRLIFRVKR